MQNEKEIRPAQLTPDGTLVMQNNNQTFVMEVFFNRDSKETFQDKLLRVILADETRTGGLCHANEWDYCEAERR
jgi:hypothetical protein